MLGEAKPYFTLVAQSINRPDVVAAAAAYEKTHPNAKVIIDNLKDHLQSVEDAGVWRARVWITVKRSLLQRLLYSLSR